ncbi:hypothetical protein H4R26_002956 [Coemansia thaxteri]|uniref:Uncharacterized protein n=1 Tax=Coemansia thaxteri TaxID=2663907 RepID=A0A9W8BK03_9FUNG|nr:hypothetical protein H4R26_002956 [Coemansia thaxteri]
MYPPGDNSGYYPNYPPSDPYGGYPPAEEDGYRSMGGGGRPPAGGNMWSNNSAVGEGPQRFSMPDGGPGGLGGGPGGLGGGPIGFAVPGGLGAPSFPPNSYNSVGSTYPPPSDCRDGGYTPQPGCGGSVYPPQQGYGGGNVGCPPQSGYSGNGGGYRPQQGFGGDSGSYPPQQGFGGDSGSYPPQPGSGSSYPLQNNMRPPPPQQGYMGPPPGGNPRPQPVNSARPPPPRDSMRPPPGNTNTVRPPPQQPSQTATGPRPSMYNPKQNDGPKWSAEGNKGGRVPSNAIRAGAYKGENFYIGRHKHKDSTQVGMVCESKGGLVVAYDGKAVLFRDGYEVLCGSQALLKWIPAHDKLEPAKLAEKGYQPLACGSEKRGDTLYAATTTLNGRDYAGKVSAKSKCMLFVQDGGERKAKEYFVLCEIKAGAAAPQ